MTIELQPEDEKLVQEKLRSGAFRSVHELIHRALVCLPAVESSVAAASPLPPPRPPGQNLSDFLKNSPFAGAELDLERRKQYVRPVEL